MYPIERFVRLPWMALRDAHIFYIKEDSRTSQASQNKWNLDLFLSWYICNGHSLGMCPWSFYSNCRHGWHRSWYFLRCLD
ncbi:hypothetical protein P3L10_032279 [Capsicum annuum]